MDLTNENVMELLDWRPDTPVWCQEWRDLYDRCPPGGWRMPTPAWIDWARGVLQQPVDSYGQTAIARILYLTEPLHPQGLDRRRLRDALLALGQRYGRDYQPGDGLVDMAEQNGVIRLEKIDRWHPGMASGRGWRTFCRLTLYGKSLVQVAAMPEPFPPPEPEPWRSRPAPRPDDNWLARATAAATPAPSPPAAPPAASPACAVPDDFSWTAAFVDQQVRKFFRGHRDEYTRAVKAVVNEQMKMEKFALDFGPTRISEWINESLNVPVDHPSRCSKQNINDSATYGVLVKAFKDDPREHPVVERLQHVQSEAAKAILDEFLTDEEPGS